MRHVARTIPLGAALLISACVLPGPGHTPYGRVATLYPVGDNPVGIRGELLAASDTLWVNVNGSLVGRSWRDLQQVNVQRHRFGGKRSFAALAIGGAATGLGMMLACHSYYSSSDGGDGAGCIGLVPMFTAIWVGGGSIFAFANYLSATRSYRPGDPRLAALSRFPQGLPDTVRKIPYIPAPQRPR